MIELGELQREWLQRRAFQAAPEEACGFLMDNGKFVEIRNSHPYPYKSFRMLESDLTAKITSIDDIRAIWHTHPSGILEPSTADMQFMFDSNVNWAYIIATKEGVRLWEPGAFSQAAQQFWGAFAK